MESGLSLFPLHKCKILHLVRHAEGIHNIEGAEKYKRSPEMIDPCLSQLGWEQAETLRKHVCASGLLQRIELVITSPLLRTMQTAAIVFGGDADKNGMNASPLMVQNAKNDHTEISSRNCPPFVAHELCRERLGVNTCDKRRSISEQKNLFPAIDFSLIESDEDSLWNADVRESDEELAVRGMKFMNWLWTRKENEIAIVTHSAFLFQTLPEFVYDCHPSTKNEICTFFTNSELRSVVLVDRSLKGVPATNYPRRIPFGLDSPSDDLVNAKQESQDDSFQENGRGNRE
ncbi:phosphoglycerate mutase-like protein 1 [Amaranthus tricolor]|uniref:phosphoglycerate mutase-like protein 1 n=1 Tax=Amaranthus tricolor TaxID=29722 RepID=UPI0025830C40|nr:phosphoglycerate mutase-like protein 1 [Amaranthus tricolor]XP_057527127.1 phosphoglycerate mutase-like protein 1 [Amaranthus tricolor]XP_057527128.1 phosphoglycerate mutase-like protein 1 [Amaranthus tricolor]